MKRTLLSLLALCASSALHGQTAPPIIKVTLLGTGVPLTNATAYVASGRVTAGLLVEAGTERMLFDCGAGVMNRLYQSGGADPVNDPNIAVDKVFLSHLHTDHMADLAALYSLGWLYRFDKPLRVWGPGPGPAQAVSTGSIMQLLRIVYDTDFYQRAFAFTLFAFPISGVQPIGTDIGEGVIYSNNGVTVTAFLVDHHPVAPAYGFRVDYQGHSVAFSGDTTFSQNEITAAKGVDVLIHEIWGWSKADGGPELFDYHCPPESCAAPIFKGVNPKLAVFTHIALEPAAFCAPTATDCSTTTDSLVARTKAAGYTGPIQVGADLMVINVNAGGVAVVPPTSFGTSGTEDGRGIPAEMRRVRPLAVWP